MKIVIASDNPGKIREIREALAGFSFALIAQGELGVATPPEPHPTFVENALVKARHAAAATGLAALADDSGICADALGGAPGVRSARFAGERASDEDNNRKLIAALAGKKERGGFYYAAMVLLSAPDDPAPIVAEGLWRGLIVAEARGAGGFGYDPHFWDPAKNKTGAQMSAAEKNQVSHRGQALRDIAAKLRRRYPANAPL